MAETAGDRDHAINVQVGQRLAALCNAAGLTIHELAERLDWPHTTLGNYESGRRALSIARLYEIAVALGHAPAALLVDDQEAAAIIDQIIQDPERCAQIRFMLETLNDALPAPPTAIPGSKQTHTISPD